MFGIRRSLANSHPSGALCFCFNHRLYVHETFMNTEVGRGLRVGQTSVTWLTYGGEEHNSV
jgi:hypothetical protein